MEAVQAFYQVGKVLMVPFQFGWGVPNFFFIMESVDLILALLMAWLIFWAVRTGVRDGFGR